METNREPGRPHASRRVRACRLALLAAGLLALSWWADRAMAGDDPEDPAGEAARDAFFEGVDLQAAGDHEGAAARYELALDDDPTLHQARLYLAECFHELGLDDRARAQLELYLATPFPGADPVRAATLMVECGGDPGAVTMTPSGDGGEADVPEGGTRSGRTRSAAHWRAFSVEAGPAVCHWANEVGLVTVGPVLEIRWLPLRYLELGLRGGLGLGSHPSGAPPVRVPELAVGVAASIPLGAIRLTAGANSPLAFSRLPAGPRADVGVRGQLGLRIPFGSTPLYAALLAEGGFLVAPTVGGSIRVGVQLGPERE